MHENLPRILKFGFIVVPPDTKYYFGYLKRWLFALIANVAIIFLAWYRGKHWDTWRENEWNFILIFQSINRIPSDLIRPVFFHFIVALGMEFVLQKKMKMKFHCAKAKSMLRKTYDWTMSLAAGPRAPVALGAVSFAESSVFPIPPDVLLIPMVLSNRSRTWWFATVCTIASVLGGILGYFIGAVLYQEVAKPILEIYGYLDKFETFSGNFIEYGPWIVFFAGLTPFPYKVITIASGAVGLSLPVFILASILARGLRFFVVSFLLYYFGPAIRNFIEKRLGLVFSAFVVLLFGGFLLIRYF